MYKQLAAAIALSCVCASAMADYGFEPVAALAPDVAGARAVAVGDLTGDGRDDVAVLTAGTPSFYRNRVLLYAQTTTGFALPVAIDYTADPTDYYATGTGMALSDLDGDGDLDVVVSYGGYTTAFLSVLRNDSGAFTRNTRPIPDALQKMKFMDVDGDGHLDLVGMPAYSGITIFPGDGATGFGTGSSFQTNTYNSLFELVDMDGDGLKDLVYNSWDSTYVRRNEGTGFSATQRKLMQTGYGNAVAVADFNADGRIDLLATTGSYSVTRMLLYPQGSDGSFRHRDLLSSSPGYYLSSVRAADLDDDGRQDILAFYASYVGTLSTRLAKSTGGFLPSMDQQTGNATDYVLGDVNHDGRKDVVFLGSGGAVTYMLGRASAQGVDLAVFLGLNSGAAAIRVENRGDTGAGTYQLSLRVDPRAGSAFAGAMPANCNGYTQWGGMLEYSCTMPALGAGAHVDMAFPFGLSALTTPVNLVGTARISYQYPEFRLDNNVAIRKIGRTLQAP